MPEITNPMPEPWRAVLLPDGFDGLRLVGRLGLPVDGIEFLRRTIRVDRQLADTHGGSGVGTTKTSAGVRTSRAGHVTDTMAALPRRVFRHARR